MRLNRLLAGVAVVAMATSAATAQTPQTPPQTGGPVEVEIFSSLDWWKRPMDDVLAMCSARLQTIC